MSDADAKRESALRTAEWLENLLTAQKAGPGKGYTRPRTIRVDVWDNCDDGGESVDGFTFDDGEVEYIIALIRSSLATPMNAGAAFASHNLADALALANGHVLQTPPPGDRDVPPPAPGPERERYIHQHDCPRIWDFWRKHALGSKVCPSCLLCGQQRHDPAEWAIRHGELPDIYICKTCVDAARAPSSKTRDAVREAGESIEATETMLPCPSCGETDVDATFAASARGEVNAGCMVCGMTGPTSHTARDAADRWNALPRSTPSSTKRGPLKLDTDSQVFFYEQDHYYLSNFSAFRIHWAGLDFDTSEHAYHWARFKDAGYHQTAVMTAPSAHEAFKYAQNNKADQRANWDQIKVGVMRDILFAKARQHEYVRRKLLQTGDRVLIENSWRDPFWGWGENRDGLNMLGKLWMEVRAELRRVSPEGGRGK